MCEKQTVKPWKGTIREYKVCLAARLCLRQRACAHRSGCCACPGQRSRSCMRVRLFVMGSHRCVLLRLLLPLPRPHCRRTWPRRWASSTEPGSPQSRAARRCALAAARVLSLVDNRAQCACGGVVRERVLCCAVCACAGSAAQPVAHSLSERACFFAPRDLRARHDSRAPPQRAAVSLVLLAAPWLFIHDCSCCCLGPSLRLQAPCVRARSATSVSVSVCELMRACVRAGSCSCVVCAHMPVPAGAWADCGTAAAVRRRAR